MRTGFAKPTGEPWGMATNRLEAFSDGVIAVAVTLLVLSINVPLPAKGVSLAQALGHNWPEYVAYAISFFTIGIIWINHHVMIGRLRQTDHSILILNLLLLMSIVILPFATELIATYLRQGHGQKLAAAIYSGAFLLMSIAFATLNQHILLRRSHLIEPPMELAERRHVLARSVSGLIPYAAATALAVVSPYVTLAICAGLAAFYATPAASGGAPHRA
ncbi:MAG: TMEM175 family protein [Solirubrobacteraceae bacterium]